MTLTLRRFSFSLGAFALAALLTALALILAGGAGTDEPNRILRLSSALPHDATTDRTIAALRTDVEHEPSDVDLRTQLGLAYLTKAGEVADPRFYLDSNRTLRGALAIAPDDFAANSASGKLALARHDFRRGLRYGERARAINPTVASNYGILTDAHVELGQYAAAERTLQHWVDLRPGLSSYARVSYFRELHGDLRGALAVMKLAAESAGSKDFTYVQSLVGKLQFDLGRYAAARRAYRSVLAVDPAYPAALGGLGAVAAARGEREAALRRYRQAARATPVAEYPQAIGEIEESLGHEMAARQAYERTEFLIRRELPYGVDVRAELALFEADHGDAAAAVRLGRAELPVRPSVTTADALAWALHKAGRPQAALAMSRQAMRLGSREPGFLYRAGMIAAAAGQEARAKRLLGILLEQSPRFNALYAPRAEAKLAQIR